MEITGKAIKAFRKEQKWTQDHLAALLGVSRRTVINWENGREIPGTSRGRLSQIMMAEEEQQEPRGIIRLDLAQDIVQQYITTGAMTKKEAETVKEVLAVAEQEIKRYKGLKEDLKAHLKF